jgi:hypothetical protein
MNDPAKKVLLDTNIWISFSIGKHLATLDRLFDPAKFTLYTCENTIAEYQAVARRPKLCAYISESRIEETLNLMARLTLLHRPGLGVPPISSRDAKDSFLLTAAIELHADYIVTGDRDLLTLDPYFGTRILRFQDFLQASGLS